MGGNPFTVFAAEDRRASDYSMRSSVEQIQFYLEGMSVRPLGVLQFEVPLNGLPRVSDVGIDQLEQRILARLAANPGHAKILMPFLSHAVSGLDEELLASEEEAERDALILREVILRASEAMDWQFLIQLHHVMAVLRDLESRNVCLNRVELQFSNEGPGYLTLYSAALPLDRLPSAAESFRLMAEEVYQGNMAATELAGCSLTVSLPSQGNRGLYAALVGDGQFVLMAHMAKALRETEERGVVFEGEDLAGLRYHLSFSHPSSLAEQLLLFAQVFVVEFVRVCPQVEIKRQKHVRVFGWFGQFFGSSPVSVAKDGTFLSLRSGRSGLLSGRAAVHSNAA